MICNFASTESSACVRVDATVLSGMQVNIHRVDDEKDEGQRPALAARLIQNASCSSHSCLLSLDMRGKESVSSSVIFVLRLTALFCLLAVEGSVISRPTRLKGLQHLQLVRFKKECIVEVTGDEYSDSD